MSSLIDRWSIVHLAFWLVVGADLNLFNIPTAWHWPIVAVGIVAWELVETWLEKNNWIDGSEDWINRWISDPLVGAVGAALGMYCI